MFLTQELRGKVKEALIALYILLRLVESLSPSHRVLLGDQGHSSYNLLLNGP